jgi:hypothetical protein
MQMGDAAGIAELCSFLLSIQMQFYILWKKRCISTTLFPIPCENGSMAALLHHVLAAAAIHILAGRIRLPIFSAKNPKRKGRKSFLPMVLHQCGKPTQS